MNVVSLFVAILFSINATLPLTEMEPTRKTELMAKETKRVTLEEVKGSTIFSYDVNDNGLIVMGIQSNYTSVTPYSYMVIIDSQGNFIDAFRFGGRGFCYHEWLGDNILQYDNSGQIARLFDADGTCLDISYIMQDTWELQKDFREHVKEVSRAEQIVGDTTFMLKEASKIIRVDGGGEAVIFDLSTRYYIEVLIIGSLFIVIFAVGFIGFYKKHKGKVIKE